MNRGMYMGENASIKDTGEVYGLKDISDFPGKYSEVRGGVTMVKGIAYAYVRSDKGVEIYVEADTQGVALTLGETGITIQLVDDE